mmetsp:Transcript_63277/g.198105  ORF Transcript_63277/g.198105 Transcript_63277/m.198105 type:complete len:208 (-) Transcript_63277:1759-2382(-)
MPAPRRSSPAVRRAAQRSRRKPRPARSTSWWPVPHDPALALGQFARERPPPKAKSRMIKQSIPGMKPRRRWMTGTRNLRRRSPRVRTTSRPTPPSAGSGRGVWACPGWASMETRAIRSSGTGTVTKAAGRSTLGPSLAAPRATCRRGASRTTSSSNRGHWPAALVGSTTPVSARMWRSEWCLEDSGAASGSPRVTSTTSRASRAVTP